ncbi:MAG: BamA/TamA family outer membrane protein [Candidatus Firestonebacteria bacterium]|nr:BamA/TamA family outer membrane protein [Candidatus Firestonebacteria bacterium]
MLEYFLTGSLKLPACLLGLFLALSTAPGAQAFGTNKQRTHDFRWQIFETEHFEIFYYPQEESLAREVCRLAEEAWEHDTQLLRYKPSDKTPLFVYRNQVEFRETNISPSVIGAGTAGFTEAFKNRIALPAPSSPRELGQVIRHEFTHALQYDILYGEGVRSFRVFKGYLMPEWLIEGMAEYATHNWDSLSDMVMRDAVLHDRLVPLTLMDGFEHLEDVYLAYKESHLAFIYISEQYGEDKIGAILNKYKTQITLSQILRDTLGVGLAEFNQNFLTWARQKYFLQTHQRQGPGDYGTVIWEVPTGRPRTAEGPVWSPDGRFLAYTADYDQTTRIYLKPRSGEAPYAVTPGKFENFALAGHPLTWSPDGRQLAFVARNEGRTALYRLSIQDGTLLADTLPCDTFYSPAWSPDGKKIALTAVNAGVADIAVWDLNAKKLAYLTRDRWADSAPVWAPDGKSLVYISERGDYWQLAQIAAEEGGGEPRLLSRDPVNHISPAFSPDGGKLYYAGDAGGIYNLYQMDWVSQNLQVLTNLRSGAFQPAQSPDGKKIAYSVFEAGSREIFLLTPDPAKAKTFTPEAGTTVTASIAAGAETQTEAVSAASRPYEFRFSPDLLFLLAGYDSSQGFVGGGYLTASDYLGNHLITGTSNWVPGYQTLSALTYGNFMFPVDLLFTAQYQRNYYRLINLETGTITDTFNDQQVLGALQLSKPFSLYDRMEFETGVQNLQREHADNVLNQRVTQFRLSLIHDSTDWFNYEPSNGFRNKLSAVVADRLFNSDISYSLLQLNSQAYKSLDFINPYLIGGMRLLTAFSLGPEAPELMFAGIGILPETGTIRGYSYGQLLGSQVAVLNAELRFPLARNVNYTLWPLDFLLWKDIQMILFSDTGIITHDMLHASSRQLRNSVGLGFRVHTFLLGKQLLTLRFDISKITNTSAEPYYTWGFGQSF